MQNRLLNILLVVCFCFTLQACGVMGLKNVQQPIPQKSNKAGKKPIKAEETNQKSKNLSKSTQETIDPIQALAIPSKAHVIEHSSPIFLDEGIASWYGPNFHGKKTANGETYDMNGMTAAHRSLAFNSEVKVTNLENGKSVTLRINDRGPYAKERIIDLSKEAAERIDMIEQGTAKVRIELIKGTVPDLNTFCSLCENFAIQLGAFSNEFDAKIEADKLTGSYLQKSEVNGRLVYRIFYGSFTNKADAAAELDKLRSKGFDGFVRQLDNL